MPYAPMFVDLRSCSSPAIALPAGNDVALFETVAKLLG